MSERTGIGWTDHTFNPWWGCFKISDGCKNCYAESFSKRTGHDIWGPPATTERRLFGATHWREPLTWNAAAEAAGERRRVFCASMADVFEDHPAVWESRQRLWDLIEATPALDWQLLTKRPENILAMAPPRWLAPWPEHVWVGASAEHQAAAVARLPLLIGVPAPIRFLSCEPLLGPLDLQPWIRRIDWVIIGGESGPRRRPLDLAWVADIVQQCRDAGVPVFVKQDGGFKPGQQGRIPDELWLHEFPQHGRTDSRRIALAVS